MLEYLTKNETLYNVTPLGETWFGLDVFQDHHLVAPLAPVARLLLTSDGSMTQMLESLVLCDVSMDIERQTIISPAGSLVSMEGFGSEARALAREAWLTAGERPLVYAHSLLFGTDAGEYSLESVRDVTRPLGKMLRDNDIKTSRGGHMMGRIKSLQISARLGLSPEEELWGRYYTLSTNVGLKGLIFEVFSPELIDF